MTLATITNSKLSYNFYKIKKFNINGLNKLETKKLYDDVKLFRNINIFSFNKKKVSKIISSNKTVEEFDVIKIYPSTLRIEIKKTKFLAITKKNGIDYLVASNGNLIEIKGPNLELPYIFGDIDVNKFLYFKGIIDISNFEFNEIKSLYYFKSDRWDITTKDGLLLKIPSKLTLSKMNLIFEIIKKDSFNDVKIIDFRQNNMMVINE
ncbi:FtsQ-type POTRA domain-containing protein [Candidatus Pelagibacter sp.]|nr:FtsQ-type POTRA domain-containing protein [Candidatus Pelagibacter sp.]